MNARQVLVRLASEPLLQFTLLGALLFALDHYVLLGADDPHHIVVDQKKREELSAIFEEGQGRAPSPEELQALIVQWTQNEVLYREAKRMGLDQGDDMIQQRLILKLRNILFGNIVVPDPTEGHLRGWFEAHRADYDRPALFDFEQFRVSEGQDGEAVAAALAQELGDGLAPNAQQALVRTYQARPASNLVDLFGEEHTQKLLDRTDATWVAVKSSRAWHLARITDRKTLEPAQYDEVKSRVARDWQEHARRASLSDALKAIVADYKIDVAPDATPSNLRVSRSDLDTQPDKMP